MANSKTSKEKLSEYGVELENGMRTLRITSRCVPREEDTEWKDKDPLEIFIYGGLRSQNHHGKWSAPSSGLLWALRAYGCLANVDYVANPKYEEIEYVDHCTEDEPESNDPHSIAVDDSIDMEEPEFLSDSEGGKKSPVMGISFGFAAAEEVVVDEDNPYFCARDGVLFSKDMTRLIWYPYGKWGGNYTVPDGVTEIGSWAFAGDPRQYWVRREDKSIVQENGKNKYYVKYVYHRNLSRVILPDTVTVIRDNAFNHCLSLASVRLSSTLKEIRWDAFRGCKELRAIELPDSLEYIEPPFIGCDNLKRIRFLGARRQISRTWKTYSSTWYTTYLGPVPYSPDFMAGLFEKDYEAMAVDVSFDTPSFTIKDGVMFSRDRTELIWCDRHKEGTYIVPSTVTRIGKRAFSDCKNLTQIDISHPGTIIEERAFFRCEKLERVVFQGPGSVKHIGNHAFQCCCALWEMPLSEVESIGDYAFFACHRLGRTVRVSESCRHIGEKAFDLCYDLRDLYVPKVLANFSYNIGCEGKSVLRWPIGY